MFGSEQADNPGDEFVDVLPVGLTLVALDCSSGTLLYNPATRTVTWNGSIAANGFVGMQIAATIDEDAPRIIINQGAFPYDTDVNGSNESTLLTDDPFTTATGDATRFVVGTVNPTAVPGPGRLALLLTIRRAGARYNTTSTPRCRASASLPTPIAATTPSS